MKHFLHKTPVQGEHVIYFLYHNEEAPMPVQWTDPLELLGDISRLDLDATQMDELRAIIAEEVRAEGAETVWTGRAFRKNIIHSFGHVM